MLGLLVKDLRLLMGQKRFSLTVVLLSVIFVISGQEPMFVVSYVTMLCTFFTISTINYDEFNHGFAFLMTLPISRRGYVIEKYLFGLLVGGTMWFATTVLCALYSYSKDSSFVVAEWFAISVITVLILGVLFCFMLPVQLKFGAEKGRTTMFLMMIVIFGGVAVVMKMDGIALAVQEKMQWIETLNSAQMIGICATTFAVVAAISIALSIRIMQKKQF